MTLLFPHNHNAAYAVLCAKMNLIHAYKANRLLFED